MTLTLAIRNVDRLDNGVPTEFVLHRRGAVIGRSPTCDWSLPDPRNHISSRHCEVTYRDGYYVLNDISTNGTYLNGAPERMSGERRVAPGDIFLIGRFEVVATLSGAAAAAAADQDSAGSARVPGWGGWESPGAAPVTPLPAGPDSGWGPPPDPGGSGWGPPPPGTGRTGPSWGPAPPSPPPPQGGGWAPSHRAPDLPPVASTWESAPAPPPPPSGWSSAVPDRPPEPTPDDVWGRLAEGNVVDWARGGFGQPVPPPQRDPLGLDRPRPAEALPEAPPRMADFGAPPAASGWASQPAPPPLTPPPPLVAPAPPVPPPQARPVPPPAPAPAPPAAPAGAHQVLGQILAASQVDPAQIRMPPQQLTERLGQILKQLVAGLVVMMEARARAKAQLGAEATMLVFDGNNPIKFARTPEQALAQLLNPPERGFMDADRAIEDAYFDLQSHQMATLKAMQGALKATLDRFSPASIRSRAERGGVLSKILPGAADAALWQAYEREFGGVAHGSDEAFMDVFAKEFRRAYEEQSRQRR